MRNFTFLFLLALLSACHKEDEKKVEIFLPGPKIFGSGAATKEVPGIGAVSWEASGIAVKEARPGFFDLDFGTENSAMEQREDLGINEIPLVSGRYAIQGGSETSDGITGASYHRLTAHGDIQVGSYYPILDSGNFIEVTVDTLAKTAKGTFSVSFKLDRQDLGQDLPETINFKNGTFDVKFSK